MLQWIAVIAAITMLERQLARLKSMREAAVTLYDKPGAGQKQRAVTLLPM
jgi:hypothetical protein